LYLSSRCATTEGATQSNLSARIESIPDLWHPHLFRDESERPGPRRRSWKRGSERRLSKRGSILRYVSKVDRSTFAFSSNSNAVFLAQADINNSQLIRRQVTLFSQGFQFVEYFQDTAFNCRHCVGMAQRCDPIRIVFFKRRLA